MIILASGSPRRRELLGAMGVQFVVRPSNINEDPLAGETPLRTQHRITLDKARAAENELLSQASTIIACDTTVLLDGEMLNKPADEAEAWDMLRRLRNRTHAVQSCLVVKTGNHEIVDTVTTQVAMRDYSDDEIATYIATGDPFDKAGSYAAQHPHFKPVAQVQGCPLNVIGLALCRLRQHLPHLPDCNAVCEKYTGNSCEQHLANR